jgi:D-sedoheptulose 7-phosphate isomerase
MMTDRARIAADLDALAQLLATTAGQVETIAAIADRYRTTLRAGGTLLFAGNGGSAADAQHLAAEYVVRFRASRGAHRALALTTDTSVLTAAANDLGFDQVFARQVEALGRPGDLLILHSTSGESANLLAAAQVARARGIPVVAFLGKGGGRLAALADLALVVASDETSHVQEVHLVVQHSIAGLLDGETPG